MSRSPSAWFVVAAAFCLSSPALAQQQQQKNPVEQFFEWLSSIAPKPPPPKPEELPPKNTITLNPLALEHEQLGIEYERTLADFMAFYLAPQATYGSAGSSWVLDAGLNLGVRFFVLGKAPWGIFFGPELGLNYARAYQLGVTRRAYGIGFGAGVGLSLIFLNRFAFSVGFSAQYRSVPDIQSPTGDTVRTSFSPLPRLAFGVAF